MKTTIDISDTMFRQLRQWAARYDSTMREVIEAALRAFFSGKHRSTKAFVLRKHPFCGQGLSPDIQSGDWSGIRQRIYEDRGG